MWLFRFRFTLPPCSFDAREAEAGGRGPGVKEGGVSTRTPPPPPPPPSSSSAPAPANFEAILHFCQLVGKSDESLDLLVIEFILNISI